MSQTRPKTAAESKPLDVLMAAVEEASEYLRWVIPVVEYRAERAMRAGNDKMADYLTQIAIHCVRAQTELLLAIEVWRGERQSGEGG